MAIGHLFDGKSTLVFGSHTHVPTSMQEFCQKVQLIKRTLECVVIMTQL